MKEGLDHGALALRTEMPYENEELVSTDVLNAFRKGGLRYD